MNKVGLFVCVCIMFLSTNIWGQETKILVKGTDELYGYEHVFEAPGKSKDDIFASLKAWVIRNVVTQSNTNYFDEAEKKTISTAMALSTWQGCTVSFKVNIDIKDSKYRLTASSFTLFIPGGFEKNLGDYSNLGNLYVSKKNRQKIIDDVEDFLLKTTISMEKATKNAADKASW